MDYTEPSRRTLRTYVDFADLYDQVIPFVFQAFDPGAAAHVRPHNCARRVGKHGSIRGGEPRSGDHGRVLISDGAPGRAPSRQRGCNRTDTRCSSVLYRAGETHGSHIVYVERRPICRSSMSRQIARRVTQMCFTKHRVVPRHSNISSDVRRGM